MRLCSYYAAGTTTAWDCAPLEYAAELVPCDKEKLDAKIVTVFLHFFNLTTIGILIWAIVQREKLINGVVLEDCRDTIT